MDSEYIRRIVNNARELETQTNFLDASLKTNSFLNAATCIENIESCIAVIEYALEKVKRQIDTATHK